MKTSDILSYLPPVLAEVMEFKMIAEAENGELSKLYKRAQQILDNQFCDTLDEEGAKRFENMLGLASSGDIAARRFRIKTALSGRLPFTEKALFSQLVSICGEGNFELSIDRNACKISVHLTTLDNAKAVEDLLFTMSPANMITEVSRLYRRHKTVRSFKHRVLKNFTHGYIKEGGME